MRLFGPPPPLPEDTLRTFTEYDPELGWRGRPLAEGGYRTRRFEIHVTHNTGGFRDDETPAASAGDPSSSPAAPRSPRRRILLLGDSFAWGYGVERGEMFADRLEELVQGWEVVNRGVAGYGTDQELLVLERRALWVQPDLIVVEFAVENDIHNILSARAYDLPKPRFLLDGANLRLEGVPVPRTAKWDRAARGDAAKNFLSAHLRLYSWARPRWASLRARIARAIGRGGEDVAAMRRVRLLARQPGEQLEAGWRLAEAILAAIRIEAAKRGARVVLLDVPDRLQVDDALWEEAVSAFGLDRGAYDRDLPERRLAAIGEHVGISVVELLGPLRKRMRAGEKLYLDDDIHWNAKGHGVAAEELALALRRLLGAAAGSASGS